MKITFIAYGTRGDVQPALALGRALQARGHRVRLLASANFTEWIEGYGLEAAPARVDIQAIMQSEGGNDWIENGNNPLKQLQAMKKLLDEHGLGLIQDAWQGCQGSEVVVSSFTSMNYAPSLAGALGARHIVTLLQPALVATRSGAATLNAPLPGRASLVNYLFGKWLIEPGPWRLTGGVINRFRRETLGLPPQTQAENSADLSAAPVLLGYSPHVVPRPADWPPNLHIAGYWFLDDEPAWTPPRDLARFLESGDPPVYIGFGSMTGRGRERFNRLILDAAARSGRRVILLSGWAGLGDLDLPPAVFRLEAAPHAWLFPRVAAVVHHGGAGTTAAALRAGAPQVIIPHMSDQPFWGARVEALGVGPRAIPRPKLTAGNLAAAIHLATTDPAIRQRAAALGAEVRAEDGVGAAVALIEQYLGSR